MTLRTWIAFIFTISLPTVLTAQVSSLDTLLRKANDPKRLPESVILMLTDALPGFENTDDLAAIKIRLSQAYVDAGVPDSAVSQAWHALALAPANQTLASQAYMILGTVASGKSSYEKALDFFRKALPSLQAARDRSGLLQAMSQMARIEEAQGLFTEAVYDYQQSIAAAMEGGNLNIQIGLKRDLGRTYRKMKRYPEALTYLSESAESARLLGDSLGMSLAIEQLGDLSLDRSDYPRAIDYYKHSLRLDHLLGLRFSSYHNLVHVYRRIPQLDSAAMYLDSTMSFVNRSGSMQERMTFSRSRYLMAQEKGDSIKALGYFKVFAAYEDTIQQMDADRRVQQVRDDLILGSNESSIRRSELETKLNEANRNLETQWKNMQLTIGGFAALIIVLLYLGYRDRVRTSKAVKERDAELASQHALREKLFTVITHDLQAPLATFSNLTRSLAGKMKSIRPEEVSGYLENMYRASIELERALTHAVEWSLVQSGKMPFHPEMFQCKQLAFDVIDKLKTEAAQKNIRVDFLVPDTQQAYGDRAMVEIVLRSLLSNAIRYSPPGRPITIFSGQKETLITLGVKDHGVGMSPGKLRTVFEWTDRSASQSSTTPGIGLPLCRQLVSANGGMIYAESQENEGSTFYFSLPEHGPV